MCKHTYYMNTCKHSQSYKENVNWLRFICKMIHHIIIHNRTICLCVFFCLVRSLLPVYQFSDRIISMTKNFIARLKFSKLNFSIHSTHTHTSQRKKTMKLSRDKQRINHVEKTLSSFNWRNEIIQRYRNGI